MDAPHKRYPSADFLAECAAFALIDDGLAVYHDRPWCVPCVQRLHAAVKRRTSKIENSNSNATLTLEHRGCFSCPKCHAVYPKWHYARFGHDRTRAQKACRTHSSSCDGLPPEVTPQNGVKIMEQKAGTTVKSNKFRLWETVLAPLNNQHVFATITLVRDTIHDSYVVQYGQDLTFAVLRGDQLTKIEGKEHFTCKFCNRVNKGWYFSSDDIADYHRAHNALRMHQRREHESKKKKCVDEQPGNKRVQSTLNAPRIKVPVENDDSYLPKPAPASEIDDAQEPAAKKQRVETLTYPRIVPGSFRCYSA